MMNRYLKRAKITGGGLHRRNSEFRGTGRIMSTYRNHWLQRPWALKFQSPFFEVSAPMGALTSGRLIELCFAFQDAVGA